MGDANGHKLEGGEREAKSKSWGSPYASGDERWVPIPSPCVFLFAESCGSERSNVRKETMALCSSPVADDDAGASPTSVISNAGLSMHQNGQL